MNIIDNWSNIQNAFNQGIWNGIGSTLGYAAVGAAQGVTATYLAPISPILSSVASSAIGNIGNGLISGQNAGDIIKNTVQGVFTGIATGGISQALGGSFDKFGRLVSSKISNKIINTMTESFVSNFGVQLTTNMAIDALDGDGFNFGDNLLTSFKGAVINSSLDGASVYAMELKQRQLDRKAANFTRVITGPVVNPQENTLSKYGMVTDPITKIPVIPYQPQSTPSTNFQSQRNIDMIKRLQRLPRATVIIKNIEGR